MTGSHFFCKTLSLFWDSFSRQIVAFFETSVLKEIRVLRYFHNKSAVFIPKLQNIDQYLVGLLIFAEISTEEILLF